METEEKKAPSQAARIMAQLTLLGIVAFIFYFILSPAVSKRKSLLPHEAVTLTEIAWKKELPDPSSYSSVDSKYWLIDSASSKYKVLLKYRAKNEFGAMALETHTFFIDTTGVIIQDQ
jgi:hypothetical protein